MYKQSPFIPGVLFRYASVTAAQIQNPAGAEILNLGKPCLNPEFQQGFHCQNPGSRRETIVVEGTLCCFRQPLGFYQ